MPKANRLSFLQNPKLKELYDKEIAKTGEKNASPKKASPYVRIQRAVASQIDWSSDQLILTETPGRIELVFENVDIVGTNVLLRCHQAKVNAYKELWEKRIRALVWQSKPTLQRWDKEVTYPLRLEAVYWSGHASLMDEDNLIGATKVILDSIVRNTNIPDDAASYIKFPMVLSKRSSLSRLLIALYPLIESPLSPETNAWADIE